MNYLHISKFHNKVIFVAENGNEFRANLGSSEPKLMAITEHNEVKILTETQLGKATFNDLYLFAQGSSEFYSPAFSFKKGEETSLAFLLSGTKYAFAYLEGSFKCYDRRAETWREVRHFFENADQESAFKTLAQKGSFVLGLDRLSIEDFFYASDVLSN